MTAPAATYSEEQIAALRKAKQFFSDNNACPMGMDAVLEGLLSAPSATQDSGPDFNTESNLHADTVSERYDSSRIDKPQGETPRTDKFLVAFDYESVDHTRQSMPEVSDFCRQLERELAQEHSDKMAAVCQAENLVRELQAVQSATEGTALDLLRRIRSANIIYPSMCANNCEAMNLLAEIDALLASASTRSE